MVVYKSFFVVYGLLMFTYFFMKKFAEREFIFSNFSGINHF